MAKQLFHIAPVLSVVKRGCVSYHHSGNHAEYLGLIAHVTGEQMHNALSSEAMWKLVDACADEILRQHPRLEGRDIKELTRMRYDDRDIFFEIVKRHGLRFAIEGKEDMAGDLYRAVRAPVPQRRYGASNLH